MTSSKVPPGTDLATIALAGTFGILSFGGFESSISGGEESRRPMHVIPRSIVVAVAFGAVFYVFCISGQVLGFGADGAGVSQFVHSSAPLGDLGRLYVGRRMADLLDVAAVLSSLGAALVGVAVASRRFTRQLGLESSPVASPPYRTGPGRRPAPSPQP